MLFLHSLRNLPRYRPPSALKPTVYYVPVAHGAARVCPGVRRPAESKFRLCELRLLRLG